MEVLLSNRPTITAKLFQIVSADERCNRSALIKGFYVYAAISIETDGAIVYLEDWGGEGETKLFLL